MPPLSSRVCSINESATLAVDAKAKQLRASGEDVIGFGAGEPDFPTPGWIVAAAAEACADHGYHHYTPTPGLPALREAVTAKTRRDSGLEVGSNQVLITNGGKHALFNAFLSILDQDDEVIIPAPYWVSYPEQVGLAGGKPVAVETDVSSGFKVTVDQLEEAATQRTKALVFVSPSNPTGAVYSRAEMEEVGRWAAERGIWVVTDEIYEHLVYGDARFESMPVVVPEIADRCIVINGVAKTYAMTGWRVGWMIGPVDLIKAASSLQSHATSNVANVAQAAALAAVSGGLDDLYEMRAAFDRRRLTITKMLQEIDGVTCIEPEGAFYAFPSFKDVLGRTYGGRRIDTTLALADHLLDEAKVAIVPGEGFGAPGYARLSYALGDDELVEGVSRIAEALG